MIGGYEDLGCGCTDEDLGGGSRDVDDKMIAVEEDEVEEDCDAAIVVVVEASVAADIPSSGWMLPRAQG